MSETTSFSAVATARYNALGARYWAAICACLVTIVVLSLTVDALFDRDFSINLTDGVAYLDISDAVMHGKTGALLNPYWSPGYPIAISIGRVLLQLSPASELGAIYIIHGVIAILALVCLAYFVIGLPAAEASAVGLTRTMLLALACAMFLVSIQIDVPMPLMTPDLLLSAFVWLGAGAFLRIAQDQRMVHYGLLALAVSLAYFTKSAALVLAIGALAILPFAGPNREKARRGALLFAVVAGCVIAPYVAKLSAAKGRFTFGESGGLNYAWIVDQADGPHRWHMQNDTPHGHARMQLTHPARRLMRSPDVYEFATPVDGSYPVFDDVSYWDDGLKPAFYLTGQVKHIALNIYHSLSWLARHAEFAIGLILLIALQRRFPGPGQFREILPVLLWLGGMWAIYLLVDVEARYIFALMTAMLLLLAAGVRLRTSDQTAAMLAVCTFLIVSGIGVMALDAAANKVYYGVRDRYIGQTGFGPYADPYWEEAQTLTGRLGLHQGDSVACIPQGCERSYWARLAGVRITAELAFDTDYWGMNPSDRAKAMSLLASAGVKAVVTRHLGPGAESEGWIALTNPHEAPSEDLFARLTK